MSDTTLVEYFSRPNPKFPFSESVRVGNILFLSGTLGIDAKGQLVPGGIGPETTQTMDNIKASLERRGLTMDDLVDVTVMMADMSEWPAMNEIYRTYFPNHFPARNAFGANGLALGARVEIACKAVIR